MGFLDSVFCQAFFTGFHQIVYGFQNRSAASKMKSQRFVEFWQPVFEELFYYQTNPFMNCLPVLFEQAVVNHLLGQGMLKYVFQIRLNRFGFDKIKTLQTIQVLGELIFLLSDSIENFIVKGPPDYRSLL